VRRGKTPIPEPILAMGRVDICDRVRTTTAEDSSIEHRECPNS